MTNSKLLALPCYCATLRQAARAVSALYEESFAGTGLYATQFTVLQLLQGAGTLSTTEVAATLGVDQTTATRILALLKKESLITLEPNADRRRRVWTLTTGGDDTVNRLKPVWEHAQKTVEKTLGRAEALALKSLSFESATRLTAR